MCPVCASMPWGNPSQKSQDFVSHMNLRHKFEYDVFVVSTLTRICIHSVVTHTSQPSSGLWARWRYCTESSIGKLLLWEIGPSFLSLLPLVPYIQCHLEVEIMNCVLSFDVSVYNYFISGLLIICAQLSIAVILEGQQLQRVCVPPSWSICRSTGGP